MLESMTHDQNAFVTLTYNDEHVPVELRPRDMQLFLKRLRKGYPRPLRFFGVGEYGSQTFRPHFHLALFGFSIFDVGHVEAAWAVDGVSLGFVSVGELNEQSARYIAKYSAKCMNHEDVPELQGKHPEFARMSNGGRLRSGGIGAKGAEIIGSSFTQRGSSGAVAIAGDVPREVRIGGVRQPLGRYMRQRLRSELGWDSKTPGAVLREIQLSRSVEDVKAQEAKRKASALSASARIKIGCSKRRLR